MNLQKVIRVAITVGTVFNLLAAHSTRVVKAELANIKEVHLYVLVSPRGKYPDHENAALSDRLEQAVTESLSANRIKSLRLISDGNQWAPSLDIHVTWDTPESDKPLAFVHIRMQIRETATIKRLKGVSVSEGAITWHSDELSHVQIDGVEKEIQRVVLSRLSRLIDEIKFATESTIPAQRRSRQSNSK